MMARAAELLRFIVGSLWHYETPVSRFMYWREAQFMPAKTALNAIWMACKLRHSNLSACRVGWNGFLRILLRPACGVIWRRPGRCGNRQTMALAPTSLRQRIGGFYSCPQLSRQLDR